MSENFKVMIRVRPPLRRELDGGQFVNVAHVDSKSIVLSEAFDTEVQFLIFFFCEKKKKKKIY
jgi:hypothetical protein